MHNISHDCYLSLGLNYVQDLVKAVKNSDVEEARKCLLDGASPHTLSSGYEVHFLLPSYSSLLNLKIYIALFLNKGILIYYHPISLLHNV